jgi:hypothetical protein
VFFDEVGQVAFFEASARAEPAQAHRQGGSGPLENGFEQPGQDAAQQKGDDGSAVLVPQGLVGRWGGGGWCLRSGCVAQEQQSSNDQDNQRDGFAHVRAPH